MNRVYRCLVLIPLLMCASVVLAEPEGDAKALQARAVELGRKGEYSAAIDLFEKALKLSKQSDIEADYIVVLSWAGRHGEAIRHFSDLPGACEKPLYLLNAVAKSYRDNKTFDKARALYQQVLAKQADDSDAARGLALTWQDENKLDEALSVTEKTLQVNPRDVNLLFLSSSLWWAKGDRLRALRRCDDILGITPGNAGAINIKARLLSDLGAVTEALVFADSHKDKIDPAVLLELESNVAARRIRWNEPQLATNILNRLIAAEEKPMSRIGQRFDLILALHKLEQMKGVIDVYEELVAEKVNIPFWIDQSAAGAYLYLRDMKKAVELYKKVLAVQPNSYESMMGLYNSYVEDSDFKKAGEARDGLEPRVPPWLLEGGSLGYNWNREEVVVARGWWLAYQNRLSEAEVYFKTLLEKAPANLGLRTGLGVVHGWRGWPRKALQDVDVVITMSGTNELNETGKMVDTALSAKNARISDLNESFRGDEARFYGAELLARNPENLHTIQANRAMRLQDTTALYFDAVVTDEHPGVREEYFYADISQPLTPDLSVYALGLYRNSSGFDSTAQYRRAGVGSKWDFNETATIRMEYSMDTALSGEEGVLGRLTWHPDDYWIAEAGYTTFSLDVPLRARVLGVQGKRADGAVRFRLNDLFSVGTYVSMHDLDDGNRNMYYGLRPEQVVFNSAFWLSKVYGDFSIVENSEQDVPYFSPSRAAAAEAVHMLQQTLYRKHDYAFVHRLYTGFGVYNQVGYRSDPIWDIKYEHDYLITDRTALLWGVNLAERYYDGESTRSTSFYLTYRQIF